MIKRIALALDGSPESEHGLSVTEELARATGAAITVVHVREMMLAPVVGGIPRRIDEDEVEKRIRSQVADLAAAGSTPSYRSSRPRMRVGLRTRSSRSHATSTPG
jgi:nucleotide-binding universal stress UspA family protein